MFQFFDTFINIFETTVNFIKNLFAILLVTIQAITTGFAWLVACVGWLPGWLTAFILVPISLSILYQVINKGS